MSGIRKDLTGERYGMLTVLSFAGMDGSKSLWLCKCDCGNTTVTTGNRMRTGITKSCGCLKHAQRGSHLAQDHARLHGVWTAMKRRCYNEKTPNHKNYGERGIAVCDEWQTFEGFYKWAMSSGYDESAPRMVCTLDRIDVNGNYESSNCRWVNAKTQANNTRFNKLVTIDGATMNYTEWEAYMGLYRGAVYQRIKRGWSERDAILTPATKSRKGVRQNRKALDGQRACR